LDRTKRRVHNISPPSRLVAHARLLLLIISLSTDYLNVKVTKS
jgi:hypothetical protein